MSRKPAAKSWNRRTFLKLSAAGLSSFLVNPFRRVARSGPVTGLLSTLGPIPQAESGPSRLFGITEIPDQPFVFGARPFTLGAHPNYHAGLETLLALMGPNGHRFYRSSQEGLVQGPTGLIAPDDVVLIKVNAQWKYRGCTNSDLIRGLVQRILDHPDGFQGEVVIIENGQGRGSLACDTSRAYDGNTTVEANANDRNHSFLYLVDSLFKDPRVSAKLMDPFRTNFLTADDHAQDGYRKMDFVSYPCFTTAGGRRVELREGIWNGSGYGSNLKLINVPVLKHHDMHGAEITASLKHFYGILSMADRTNHNRHYAQLGETTGTMVAKVRTPVLNIIDATWVSFGSIRGYPAETTFRSNQLLASQDPVALDYWAAKYILYPIDNNTLHHPDNPYIDAWLTQARDTINAAGGLADPDAGISAGLVTKDESQMSVLSDSAARFLSDMPIHPPRHTERD